VQLIASRLTSDPDEAKEVVQDTVIKLSGSLHRYRRGNFDGWLYRVTRNVFLDRCRRKARERELPLTAIPSDQESGANVVEAAGDRADVQSTVRAALMRLPDNVRMPVVLRDIEGLSYHQISGILDISLGTVRSRIHRGREQLRILLLP
jgi:RNA polymerase sigma-70 factor (ECF subfamily)